MTDMTDMTDEQWKSLTPEQRAQYRATGNGMIADHASTLELDGVLVVDSGLITKAGKEMGFKYVRLT